jgi:carbon-monoxide dehydrogenase medium subunit
MGQSGERSMPIDDFLVDTFTTALKEDELITQISVPMPPESSSGGAYLKLERKAGDFATVAVAAQLTLEERSDGSYFSSAGIGLTALGAKSLRAKEAEARLIGKKVREETIAGASSAAAEECSPTDDQLRGSSKYKREMARLYTRRAIDLAVARARGRRARSSK